MQGAQLGLRVGPETGQARLQAARARGGEGAGGGDRPGRPLPGLVLPRGQHAAVRMCGRLLLGPGQPLRQTLRGEMLRRLRRHSGKTKADDQVNKSKKNDLTSSMKVVSKIPSTR